MPVTRSNFEPVSNLLHTQTRSIALATPALADPKNALAIVDGEWCIIDGSKKLARAADVTTPAAAASLASYPVWDEKGRTDNQALGGRNKTIVYLGPWECDTDIFDASGMTHNGLVSVATVVVDSVNYVGLINAGTLVAPTAGVVVVGLITRLPAVNNGRLRIRGGMHY